MSCSVIRKPDVLTHYGVQQPVEIQFDGPVDRVDSVSAEPLRGRVALSISSHPPLAVSPNTANIDLSAAGARHLIRRLEQCVAALECDGA